MNPTGSSAGNNFVGQPICQKEGITTSTTYQDIDFGFQVTGWSTADFNANQDGLKAYLAEVLGINANLIQLSTSPFQRRNLQGAGLRVYVRINAPDTSMSAINAAIANPTLFNLNSFASGVTFALIDGSTGGKLIRTFAIA